MRLLTLLPALLMFPQAHAMEPTHRGPLLLAPPTMALYQASKQGSDPQALAAELTKLVPSAEADKRYEVQVSVRELPTPPAAKEPQDAPR